MSHVNDLKLASLETLTGTTGHIDDLELAWLTTVVVTPAGNQVNDLWLRLFLENGATSGEFNTAAYEFLSGLGYTGALNDMWYSYWGDAGGGGGGIGAIKDRDGNVVRDRDGNIITGRA
jgi:hypothetical protein